MNTYRFLSVLNRNCCSFLKSAISLRYSCPTNFPLKNQIRFIHASRQLWTEGVNNESSEIFVYEGPLRRRIKFVKIISLGSSMVGLSLLPKVVHNLSETNYYIAWFVGVGSLVYFSTPLLFHYISKSYVVELHFNAETETFTAKTLNILSMVKVLQFKASDVTVPTLPALFANVYVKDKGLFIDYRAVKDPDAYAHMMGHDKPFDFEVYDEKSEDKS